MKKLLNKIFSVKIITYLLLFAIIAGVALLMRLGRFSTPWYDDYTYSKYTRSFQEAYGAGLINAIRGACFQVRESWYSWQGTFSSIFLMALSPMGFDEMYYYVGSWALILLLTTSSIAVTYSVSRKIFNFDKYHALCFSFAMSILVVWRVYNVNQAFYWFNGGIHYIGMHSFLMFFVAVLIGLLGAHKPVSNVFRVLLAVILAALVSGANFVTALQGTLLLLGITLYCAIKERKKALIYIPVIAVYGFGMFMNVTAPGNRIRSEFFTAYAYPPVKAVLCSFPEALKNMWRFSGIFTIIFMIAVAPIIWKGLENTTVKFRLPGVFAIFAFCFYATSFTPGLYGMGGYEIGRILNAIKITYQFMLIMTEVYFIGWLKGKLKDARKDIGFVWVYAACILAFAVLFAVSPAERIMYSPYGAYLYVHTGVAGAYYDGYLRRIQSIKEQGPDARVVRNIFTPDYIFHGELSTDPDEEPNRFMASWYGKESLALIDEEADLSTDE